jgi:hypothetical protein
MKRLNRILALGWLGLALSAYAQDAPAPTASPSAPAPAPAPSATGTTTEVAPPARRVSPADGYDPAVHPVLGAPAPPDAIRDKFNPDPGAAFRPDEEPLFTPPPGTPADYEGERGPVNDTSSYAPLLDVHSVPKDWQNRNFSLGNYPKDTKGGIDRWYIDIPVWQRYNNTDGSPNSNIESPYQYKSNDIWDPYRQSVLKGDKPVLGQDIFLTLTATSFTSYEARDIPTPAGVSTSQANSSEFYGQGNQQEVDQFATFSVDLFKGETVFQPLSWDLHIEPVYNFNWTRVEENGVLSVDPRGSNSQSDNGGGLTNNSGNGNNNNGGNFGPGGGLSGAPGTGLPGDPGTGFDHVGAQRFGDVYTTRSKDFLSLQEAFLEFHLADLSDNYDFVSMRVGNQPFNADFRGFVFNDTNLGVRFFGNMDSNRWQYNVAAFDMREKDTYSELNTLDSRNQYVFVANVYRQDFLTPGLTEQLDFLTNLDDADTHYDRTGNLVRPAPIGGPIEPHDIRSYYFGWNGDGHIGRINITHSFYEVIGRDTLNGIVGQPANINAQMGALEVSYDQDWIRLKASFFYASGDDHPQSGDATGFDTILDNPNFIGGPFSYYSRQGFVFGDTSVNFKQRDSLVLDLRSSKTEGQSNFVNPGVFIFGVGTEMTLTPTLKLFLNANYIRMVDTETPNFVLHTNNVSPDVGFDLSGGIQYRPLLTNNVIISAGLGALIPGDGYKAIYESNTQTVPGYPSPPGGHVDALLYSGFAAVTLTY